MKFADNAIIVTLDVFCINKLGGRIMSVIMTLDSLGERLKKARENKSLKQQEIADELGLKRNTVSMWENDLNTPSPLIVAKLAKRYDVTTDYLLGLVDDPKLRLKGEVKLVDYENMKVVPLLGKVSAGEGIFAEENILGYVPLFNKEQADFALKVRGYSMYHSLQEGDIVIVRKQPVAKNGQIAVVYINGEEGVIKRFYKHRSEVILRSDNPEYKPIRIKADQWDNECGVVGIVVGYTRKLDNQ
jgi:repressor LexA